MDDDGDLKKSQLERFHFEFNVSGSLDERKNWATSIISDVERWGNLGEAYGCKRIVDGFNLQGISHDEWIFSECRKSLFYFELRKSQLEKEVDPTYEKFISKLKRDDIDLSEFKQVLENHPELKFVLYVGKLDSIVPPSILDEELEVIENLVTYREFENSGHEGFYSEDLVWKDILGEMQ